MATLGEKRLCPSCGAKFYDLGKKPAKCPKCAHAFNPDAEAAAKPKKGKGRRVEDFKDDKAAKKKKKVTPTDDELGGLDLSQFGDVEEAADAGGEIEEIDTLGDDDNIESLSDLEERERDEDSVDGDENDEESLMEGLEDSADILDEPVDEEEFDEDEDEEDDDEDEEDDEEEKPLRKKAKKRR